MEDGNQQLNKYDGSGLKSFMARPSPALRDCIDLYCGEEYNAVDFPGPYLPLRIVCLPTACTWLAFCYHDTSFVFEGSDKTIECNTQVLGPHNLQSLFFVDKCPKAARMIHVRFKPGGFQKVFGIPDGEAKNSFYMADEVLGAEGKRIADRMETSSSNEERVEILNRFFEWKLGARSRVREDFVVLAAMESIAEAKGNKGVAKVSKELAISRRTLERKFVEDIGLSPKEFAKVVRFNNLLNRILSADSWDWHDLVETYGYYDQSHLIEEFKTATTFSPDEFLRQRGISVMRHRGGLYITKPIESCTPQLQHAIKDAMKSADSDPEL